VLATGVASAAMLVASAVAVAINLGTAEPPDWVVTVVGTGARAWWTIAGLTVVACGCAVAAIMVNRAPGTDGPATAQRQAQAQFQAQQQNVIVQVSSGPQQPVVAREGQVVAGDIPAQPPSFVSRPQLDELRAALRDGPRVAVVCALAGGPGVGKTQVAAAYARNRIRDGCPVVAWVSGETVPTLLTDLAAVAEELGVADPEGDSEKSARHLRRALQSRSEPALLVVDNAANPAAVAPFLPTGTGACAVVITSTDHAFADLGTLIDVPTYTPDESVAYLEARTGLGDPDGALAVAEELGHLAVALAQVPSVIRDRHQTYAQYLDDLRSVDLDTALPRGGGHYPRSTAQALILAITTAERNDPTGLTHRLLLTIALLAPEGVDRDLLHTLVQSTHACHPATVRQHLGALAGTSLLTWAANQQASITTHRLTARVIREHAGDDLATTADAIIAALDGLLPAEANAWPTRHDTTGLVTHIAALWSTLVQVHDHNLPLDAAARLTARAVRHLLAVADLTTALRHGTTLLTDCERVLGEDHPNTLASRNNLAYAYESAGRLDDAIPLYQRTLTDRERVLGDDHPNTLTSRNNLAGAYQSAGRLDDAIPLHQRTLTDSERVLGDDHPDTLTSRNNLAGAYRSAGRLDDAIPLYQRTLTDSERVLGDDHPDTLASRNNLAYAYRSAGRLDDAIPLYQRTLTDRERVLGDDHPNTLTSRNNLAYAYQSAGRLDDAIPLHQRTLTDSERVLGDDHPNTLTSRNNLAGAYQSAGRLDDAIPLYQRTLTDCERVLSPGHPFLRIVGGNLAAAIAERDQGRPTGEA